jgi:hypothetical protein
MIQKPPNSPGEAPEEGVKGDNAEWFNRLCFVFAKTMPEIPHEYVIRTKENWAAFMRLWDTIDERGMPGTFRGRRYKYWYRGDGWRYWCMGPKWPYLINRARVEGIGGNGAEVSDQNGPRGGEGAD